MRDRPEALLLEEAASESRRRFVILAPLMCSGQFAGAIRLSRAGAPFSAADLELSAVLAQQLSAVLSAHQLIKRLREAEARLQGERDYLRRRLMPRPALANMLGASPALSEVKRQIQAAAPARTTVLIEGETGTGKELCARAIHEISPRRSAAFAAVNCASLARGVLESELFGHVKGAFTGAHREREGLFAVADGGTLFLDEVGEMPLDLQPKLLRAIEEGEVWPVGANRPRRVDVRLVAATNRDLEAEVRAGRFRRDLWYRLNVFLLRLPPLRERREDIPALARHFLEEAATEQGRPHPGLSEPAAEALRAWGWPGNVRELKNEMERASLMAPPGVPVEPCHLSPHLTVASESVAASEETLEAAMARLEGEVLKQALRRHGFNRTHCARALGISRQALIAKIARFHIREE
ncbi:MAG: sigma-54-dependent Fis family transcriptional regulator [Myxococcales bacterium]|nr:sigma-54-dependent Fis family transcriptional regulator [Myxococcales bacterium]